MVLSQTLASSACRASPSLEQLTRRLPISRPHSRGRKPPTATYANGSTDVDPSSSSPTTTSSSSSPTSVSLPSPQSRIIGTSIAGPARFAAIKRKLSSAPRDDGAPDGYHFGGALTTLIFGAVLLSERLNGVGIVENLELHNQGFHPVLLASVALLLCASAWPEKRERGNPSFLVRLQMAGARIAYLGLAGAIAAEMFTGKGILTLLDVETGIEALSDVEAVIVFCLMLFLTGPISARATRLK